MFADLLIHNIGNLYTPNQIPPVKGNHMQTLHVIEDAYLAVKDGKILELNAGSFAHLVDEKTKMHDARGGIIVPGLIDSHTHLVHAGSREEEFKRLNQGTPYLDILKEGGGILGTVRKTTEASEDALLRHAYGSLNEMMLYGVTAVESKSGYGLYWDTEEKQLRANQKLKSIHPVHLTSTYLGAHAIPKNADRKMFVKGILEDLDRVASGGLATSVDVFCEEGVFDLEETKAILTKAKALGLTIRMHADEIHPLGGAGLGVDLGCASVDHLMAISDRDIDKLANSNTIANLLPGTSFFLNKGYANARKMIDRGVAVCVSGDYNPGSCPTENFQLIMYLAARFLKMTSEEILNAVTINAAYHLGIHESKGSLEPGKDADFVIMDALNLDYVLYHFGVNHARDVFIQGKPVVLNRQIVRYT